MEKRSAAAAWYLTGIGVFLALAGGLFTWLMARSFLRAEAILHWTRTPCVILNSEVERRRFSAEDSTEYRFSVLYGYEAGGKRREGDRWKLRGAPWLSSSEAPESLVKKYPQGGTAECLVNPGNTAEAVLEPESRAPGYSIWFPLLFVVGGVGMTVGAWRKRPAREER